MKLNWPVWKSWDLRKLTRAMIRANQLITFWVRMALVVPLIGAILFLGIHFIPIIRTDSAFLALFSSSLSLVELENFQNSLSGHLSLWMLVLLLVPFFIWRTLAADVAARAQKRQADTACAGLLNDRLAQAIALLGNDQQAVRLGGIYILERIAREEPQSYHWLVMDILCGFIRGYATWQPKRGIEDDDEEEDDNFSTAPRRPPADIQMALTVLMRRDRNIKPREDLRLDLSRADLRGANLIGAHFENTRFEEAHLEGARMENAHFFQADFEGAYLDDADLEGADLRETTFKDAYLIGTLLKNANLMEADLEDAHLEGANFTEANLRKTRFWGAHLKGADFMEADLQGASLLNADMEEANLWKANLEGADMRKANLRGARLWGAQLKSANLWTAHLEEANLMEATNLTAEQMKNVVTDDKTALPNYL
ncbi:MAG: pentapeptide repeat-containing protein [Magnetococcus sp. DMHC-6]